MSENSTTVLPEGTTPSDSPRPPTGPRRGVGWAMCLLGVVVGLGGLIGAQLGHLWILFDVLAQFTVHFIVLVIACLAGLLARRARLRIAVLLAVAGVVALGLWPQLVSRSPRVFGVPGPDERSLSVLTFNTWYGNERVDEVEAEIARIDADIVNLVEFGPNKHPIIARLASRYPYHTECFAIDYCHLAILSKIPIAATDYRMAWEGPPLLIARLGAEYGNLTVFGAHTIRFPHSRAQFRQVRALGRLLAETPGPKLVLGDFNATPFSRVTQTLSGVARMNRLTDLPSWPARLSLPQIAIDHVFATPDIRVIGGERIGNSVGSDHYPVYMTLAVPSGG